MSGLVPFGILAATVGALRGATLVGDAVIESPLDAIEDVLAEHKGRPLITVLVGVEEHTEIDARALLRGKHKLDLAIQVFLPERCAVTLDGATIELDTRGKGIEVVFGLVARQIQRALLESDASWSTLWRAFILQTPEATAQSFLLMLGTETRIAAREFEISLDTINEPAFGAPPAGLWADFVAALRADEDRYGPAIADLIAHEIEAPEGLPSWRAIQASLGLTEKGVSAIGLGPLLGPDSASIVDPATGALPVEIEATLADADRGESLTLTDGARQPYELPEDVP